LKNEIGDSLKWNSYHSKKENKENILKDFRFGKYEVLFTTNVLARGIDIRKVSLVINIFAPREQKIDK
jgi:superfamily II DNA/RNA helicase